MLNYIWLGLILSAVLLGGFTGHMKEVVGGAVQSAQQAVTIALGLIGIMAMWLGLMRVAEKSGLIRSLARLLRPVLKLLFPAVPADHPAMGSMVMNFAANMLGLTNAATPLGLRAMRDLESLNRTPGSASNAMCTFLAINTSSVQLIPMTSIGLLAANGSKNPTAIIGTAFAATLCAATAAILAVKVLERLRFFNVASKPGDLPSSAATVGDPPQGELAAANIPGIADTPPSPFARWRFPVLVLFSLCFAWFFVRQVSAPAVESGLPENANPTLIVRMVGSLSVLAIPFLLGFLPLYGGLSGVRVYEEFVEGAKEGFQVALRIIPFLVAILVAIGIFRSAGGVNLLTDALRPLLDWARYPAELVPLTLMRPLSGSASLGLLSELIKTHGPDSLLARTACTLYGSTETTFYVVAVYFGSVNIKRTRHAIPAGLIADATGAIAAVAICRLVFL